MHLSHRFLPLVVLSFLTGCATVGGVVEQSPGRPLPTAIFSVGRPGGIAIYATHHVDSRGRFHFKLAPTDETDLYLYDGAGDPQLTLRRIDASEISEHMVIQMRPANPNLDVNPTSP